MTWTASAPWPTVDFRRSEAVAPMWVAVEPWAGGMGRLTVQKDKN